MARNGTTTSQLEPAGDAVDGALHSLMDQGRAVADQIPGAVDEARSALNSAQGQLNGQLDGLSDRGVIAAVGFSAGVTAGLFLGGAPRIILALSVLPVALTVRSALNRGVRVSRLVK
jgi:hypothetical protein